MCFPDMNIVKNVSGNKMGEKFMSDRLILLCEKIYVFHYY